MLKNKVIQTACSLPLCLSLVVSISLAHIFSSSVSFSPSKFVCLSVCPSVCLPEAQQFDGCIVLQILGCYNLAECVKPW